MTKFIINKISRVVRQLLRLNKSVDIKINNNQLIRVWTKKNLQDQYQYKMANRNILHENSKELISFIQKSGIISFVSTIHEIGCGSGRNLSYILKIFQNKLSLSGNDLSQESCFGYMDDELKKIIIFFEQDTLKFLQKRVRNEEHVDLLLSSDHMMHLGRDIIGDVYKLVAQYAKKYILLREPYGESLRITDGFIWAADKFDNKFEGLKLIDSKISDSSSKKKEFKIMLFEREKI